jgi:Tfp pilus assembly protein PilF
VLGALLLWRFFTQLGLRNGWLGGLIFAVHPVNVESVAWVSELKNTMSLPPFLVGMTALVRFYETRQRRDYGLALAGFILAMLVKISMAPFPFVLLLYAWWRNRRVSVRDVRLAAPFLAVAIVLAAMTVWAYLHYGTIMPDHPEVPPLGGPLVRLALAGTTTTFYFTHLFWPWPILPNYPQWTVNPPPWIDVLPWIAWLAVLGWLWAKRATFGRHGLLGLGFFLLMIAPFCGIATQTYMYFAWVMDHFLYIPMIGPLGLLVAGVDWVMQRGSMPWRAATGAALACVVVALGLESRAYSVQWISAKALWSYNVAHAPAAWLTHYDLGNAYHAEAQDDYAIAQYRVAIALHPDFDWSHNNLGVALAATPGGLPEAMQEYREAIRLRPTFAEAHNNLANALTQEGQVDQAIGEFHAALKAQPGLLAVRYNLALALLRAGRRAEAAEQLREILQAQPDLPQVRALLEEAE